MKIVFASLLALAACNTVDPDSCRPNTSGGLGGSDAPIPIGAGVGATSGGADAEPDADEVANPCVAPGKGKTYRAPSEYSCTTRWWPSSWMCQGEGPSRLPRDASGDCYVTKPMQGRCLTASDLEKSELSMEEGAHSSPHAVTCKPVKWEQLAEGTCKPSGSTSTGSGSTGTTDPNS